MFKFILIVLISALTLLQALTLSEYQLKALYVYKLSKNIIWDDSGEYFRIHIISSNQDLVDEFKNLSTSLKIHNKKILLTNSSKNLIDTRVHVVYIDEEKEKYYKDIFHKTIKKPILLISDSYSNRKIVLINLFTTEDNTINFEINRANILYKNLKINPDLVLLGGTELDVAYLYKDTISTLTTKEKKLKQIRTKLYQSKKSLAKEKNKLIQMKHDIQNIKKKNTDLHTKIKYKEQILLKSKNEIKKINDTITYLKIEILKKNKQFKLKNNALLETNIQLKSTVNKVKSIEFKLSKLTLIHEKEKEKVLQKEKHLKTLEMQVLTKTNEFHLLRKKVKMQIQLLNKQKNTISSQKYSLIISSIILFFLILIALVIAYLLRQQKRTNTLLHSTQEELRIAKEQADKKNNNKSIFIANMSHELRTPLNAVLGYTHLLQKDTSFSSKHQKTFQIIKKSGEHLLDLINDILLISKMEAGYIEVINKSANLYEFLESIHSMFLLKTSQKNIYLEKSIESNVPQYILTDIDKLRQILINLLNNSVKFTSQGGIHIKVSIDNMYLLIDIKDSGTGISQEEIPKLFKQYQQTQSGIQEGNGTGLGLALVKEFITLLEGEINVESEVNIGSTFSLKIPYIISKEEAAKTVYKEVIKINNNKNYTVLVVDDIKTNRDPLQEMLSLIGYNTEVAINGLEAVKSVEKSRPDIILMDLRMPIMDGKEASTLILNKDKTIPIIGITASILELRSLLKDPAPFSMMMAKPFKENELLDNMKKFIDVEYIYKDEVAEHIHLSEKVTCENLLQKDKEVLLNAAKSMNITLLSKLISELDTKYQDEKNYMQDLIDDLDFQGFTDLLES